MIDSKPQEPQTQCEYRSPSMAIRNTRRRCPEQATSAHTSMSGTAQRKTACQPSSNWMRPTHPLRRKTSAWVGFLSRSMPAMSLNSSSCRKARAILPGRTRRTSEDPRNLFARAENAAELVKIVSDFETRLMELVSRSEQTEPSEEFVKFQRAVGTVVWELGAAFLYPVYRRHTHLMPDEMKGELL
jgi:hypothetical protein